MFGKTIMALALLADSAVTACAAGDQKAGAVVFKRCAVCHTDDKGGLDGLGPNLFGVVGRKAASKEDFAYSAPLRKSGIVWTETTLIKWVAAPQRMVPGTRMQFAGITSKKQQVNVVAFLANLK